jgi:hypothetical protein
MRPSVFLFTPITSLMSSEIQLQVHPPCVHECSKTYAAEAGAHLFLIRQRLD